MTTSVSSWRGSDRGPGDGDPPLITDESGSVRLKKGLRKARGDLVNMKCCEKEQLFVRENEKDRVFEEMLRTEKFKFGFYPAFTNSITLIDPS